MKPLILVIEEFEILRAQLDELLTDAGYRVRVAKTFREGIAQTQQQKYEAVLLDVGCAPDAPLHPSSADPPLLLTATKSQRQKASAILQNGARDCISKPFNRTELLSKVAGVIKSRESPTAPQSRGPDALASQQTVDHPSSVVKPNAAGSSEGRTDIARLHLAIDRVSEARACYVKCLQQQEKNNRIICDEHYRVLEHARADLEIQLNEYIDARIKLAYSQTEAQYNRQVDNTLADDSGHFVAVLTECPSPELSQGIDLEREVTRYEIDLITKALRLTDGHQSRAARLLRMNPTTLNSKIKKYGIVV